MLKRREFALPEYEGEKLSFSFVACSMYFGFVGLRSNYRSCCSSGSREQKG
jgi:hypothetical protein